MKGKVCLVTGANRGIGKATAAALATSPEVESVTGTFFKGRKPIESDSYSRDTALQSRLWNTRLTLL
jgi:hypothetical protein